MKIHHTSLVFGLVGAALLPVSASPAQTPANVSFADSKATWDGMFHVPVHCGAATTCTGRLSVRAPGSSQEFGDTAYSVAAYASKTVVIDPAGSDNAQIDKLSQVDARLSPDAGQGDPVEATLALVRPSSSQQPGSTPPGKLVGIVHDKKGDGVRRLDLRTVSAKVRKGRLILRFTCWKRFGAADFDHDVANFHAFVGVGAGDSARHRFIDVFMAHGQPFTQAGRSQFPNHRVRFSRPDGRSVQLSIPVRVFSRTAKRLYLYPAAFGNPKGEDRAPRLVVKV
jgi:hypothetical protein